MSRVLCFAAGIAIVGPIASIARAAEQNSLLDPDQKIKFELPAQPLISALERYSVVSGMQVIYDANLATGRRSTSVYGNFAPATALKMLLVGTGLTPQYVAADGVVLTPDPAANVQRDVPTEQRFSAYYGRIQAGLKHVLCEAPPILSGRYRVALGLWLGPSGAVTRSSLLGSTGKTEIDQAFDRAVRMLSVGEPPPVGFDQPVIVLVTPDLISQCGLPAKSLQPVRAGQ